MPGPALPLHRIPSVFPAYMNAESTSPPPVDLRSDTVTRPTPAMLEAMFSAPRSATTCTRKIPPCAPLENTAAAHFGLEAGFFCPSGTMTNQIAIKCQTQPWPK